MKNIGIDIGGTFTDLVFSDEGQHITLKVPSTPDDPSVAAIEALRQLRDRHGVELEAVDALSHGSTVATNALIQRRGGKTALITTAGFRDVLEIARLGRPPQAIYDIHYQHPEPVVPRALRFEIEERVNYRGDVERELNLAQLEVLAERLVELEVESVAICLLFSFLHPDHERQVKATLARLLPTTPVLCSSDILPERREYERTSTTAISAYLAPTVTRYIEQMREDLERLEMTRRFYIMQSNGGLNTPETATSNPGSLLLSGPAAGIVAAARIGVQAGFPDLISMDMGGTSFDVALIQNGRCLFSNEALLDEAAFNIPMLDIKTVGAGGGSIAWLDNAGKLRIGPQSAGAQPGPACYGLGGDAPAVTDANLLLGFLDADKFLGGAMRIETGLAENVVRDRVAKPLKMSVLEAAAGIRQIVNANMAGATRLVSVEKGHDPRDFALLAFGGAGPVHAVAIAEELEVPWVVVPRYPGATSAAGLVVADIVHDFVQSTITELSRMTPKRANDGFDTLIERARQRLQSNDVPSRQQHFERSLDIKYVGQGYTLEIAVPRSRITDDALTDIARRFHDRHEAFYGFRAEGEPVEIINFRLQATGELERITESPRSPTSRDPSVAHTGERMAWSPSRDSLISYQTYDRHLLETGAVVIGPAIVEQADSTTIVPPDWVAVVDGLENLIIGREEWQPHD